MSAIRRLFDKVLGRDGATDKVRQPFNATAQAAGYYRLPGTMQWSPGPKEAVDKTKWKPCEVCGRAVPVDLDMLLTPADTLEETGTWTFVCPFCSPCQVGSPYWSEDAKNQKLCHE